MKAYSLAVLVFLGFFGKAPGDTPGEVETRALIRLLNESMDMKDFHNPGLTLKEALGLICEKFTAQGKDVPILVNEEAFKKMVKNVSISDQVIRFPAFPRKMSLAAALRLALAQVEGVEATFLVRNATVEIVPAKLATPAHLLQTKFCGAFTRTPLEKVLQEFSYQSGASLVLDPRAGAKARTAITVTFRNDVTVDAALGMVTEMVQLKVVVLNGGLFVTTPAHAEMLHKELKDAPRPGPTKPALPPPPPPRLKRLVY